MAISTGEEKECYPEGSMFAILRLPNSINIVPFIGAYNLAPLAIGVDTSLINVLYRVAAGLDLIKIAWDLTKIQ